MQTSKKKKNEDNTSTGKKMIGVHAHSWWSSPATCTGDAFCMPTGPFTGVHKHMSAHCSLHCGGACGL